MGTDTLISNGNTPGTYLLGHGNDRHSTQDYHRDHGGHERILEAIGNAHLHGLNAEQVTQKAVGDSTLHVLNSEHITQKEVADATRDILLDQSAIKQQIGGVIDTLHQDGNFTRNDVKSEGRNLDNKICDVEHHIADARRETQTAFCRTNELIQENKFELTKQNGELQRYLAEKLNALNTEVYKQGAETRLALDAVERRDLERDLQECRLRETCRQNTGDVTNIINSQIANSLGPIVQALTQLSANLKV